MTEQQMIVETEQTPKQVEQIVLCDLDRAMVKSDELVGVVHDFLVESGRLGDEEVEALGALVADIHDNAGAAVQPYEVMREAFGLEDDPDELAEAVIEEFGIDELRERVLVPGADMLFAALQVKHIDHAILTSATDRVGQQFKIRIFERLVDQSGIPYWIINHETKASTAEDHWLDSNTGQFNIPPPDNIENGGWQAKRVCLIDDKIKNLKTRRASDAVVPIHVYADNVPAEDAVSLLTVANAVAEDQDLNDLRWDRDDTAA